MQRRLINLETHKLEALTEKEKLQAEKNHGLIYSFLHRHKYSIEEFYNIVIFGYLKGIQVYNRREDLQNKYQLAFICEQYMKAEIKDHFRGQNSQKRKVTEAIISLDNSYMEMDDYYNCIGGKSAEEELLEAEQIAEMLENLSEIQKKIIEMKIEGYGNSEIYLLLKMPSSTFYKEINRIKSTLGNLKGGH